MILTRPVILKEIKKKRLSISPFREKNLGAASYDLTLSNEFRRFKGRTAIPLTEETDFKEYTEGFRCDQLTLQPGELIIGISREKLVLPPNICAKLEGRTRFARLGLLVHMTAGFVHPGVSNRQVFEIGNSGPRALIIKPGLRLCQVIFMRCEGEARYTGWTNEQSVL